MASITVPGIASGVPLNTTVLVIAALLVAMAVATLWLVGTSVAVALVALPAELVSVAAAVPLVSAVLVAAAKGVAVAIAVPVTTLAAPLATVLVASPAVPAVPADDVSTAAGVVLLVDDVGTPVDAPAQADKSKPANSDTLIALKVLLFMIALTPYQGLELSAQVLEPTQTFLLNIG
jgi:hypothetical protein